MGSHPWEMSAVSALVLVRNADRMMTSARAHELGVELTFADGCKGTIPFSDLPEIGNFSDLANVDLPNPFEIVLTGHHGGAVELPWDFARHYCDPTFRAKEEEAASHGRTTLGSRIRQLRETASMTQRQLAEQAGVGRVTLARIEGGEQSPRYGTLLGLARALGRPLTDLIAG